MKTIPGAPSTVKTAFASQNVTRVLYGDHRVSDSVLRATLDQIAFVLKSDVILTSGDRQHVVNANRKSHHLKGRAADFYVKGMSLSEAYERLKELPFLQNGFQLIYHSEETVSPHLHLGRYLDRRNSSFIVDRGSILPLR